MKSLSLITAILLASVPFASAASDVSAQDTSGSKLEFNTGHSAYAAVGLSHIVTSVDDYYVTSGEPRIGANIQLGYEWISPKKIGAGFLYDSYITQCTLSYGPAKAKEHLSFHYFAPQFSGRIFLRSDKWVLNYSIGVGLFMSYERLTHAGSSFAKNYDFGFGSNLSFGAERRLSSKLGLTMALSMLDASVKQSFEGVSSDSSLLRININVGVKYHF